jgi:Zn-dependent metalloprotease
MSTMMSSLYENEYGAINEALSDIQGNNIEISLDGVTDGAWLIGERSGTAHRSMSEPNLYQQPGYFWDRYYVPIASIVTDMNDYGGVHTNSSLLNIISYRLEEAGMTLQEQFLYWLGVTRALLPRTDFAQLAQILPWCMEEAGYSQYVDAVNQAVEGAAYTHTGLPDKIPQGCGMVTFEYQNTLEYANYNPVVIFMDAGTGEMEITWPEKATNQEPKQLPSNPQAKLQ